MNRATVAEEWWAGKWEKKHRGQPVGSLYVNCLFGIIPLPNRALPNMVLASPLALSMLVLVAAVPRYASARVFPLSSFPAGGNASFSRLPNTKNFVLHPTGEA
jgi:hypothetical protein